MTKSRRKVAVLGGGMGGLAAAWRLSEPGWQQRFDRITVYQRGGRLGGKAASSRGVNGRVEEHGLHVWLGYYDNAFAMMRDCYEELDRATTRPACPIRSIDDAFFASDQVGLFDDLGGAAGPEVSWSPWLGHFTGNDLVPGDPQSQRLSFTPLDIVRRSIRLLGDFFVSIDDPIARTVSMSGSPEPPRSGRSALTAGMIRSSVALAVEALNALETTMRLAGPTVRSDTLLGPVVEFVDHASQRLRIELLSRIGSDPAGTRMWHLVSVVLAQVRGLIADGVLADPSRIRDLNTEDYREWTIRHGAHPEAADGTLIRGLYDLVFGFRDGDPDQPGFGAGLGVFLSAKTFFDYKGAVFWKMAAGMGDVVIAPLYEALRQRGVDFEFFTRVDELHLDPTSAEIASIDVTRQVRVKGGAAGYDPLIDVAGIPCFSRELLADQLAAPPAAGLDGEIYESHWWPDDGATRQTLVADADFDDVVFALPVGMAPLVSAELMERHPPWRAMCRGVATVSTEALQLWLGPAESALGWGVPGSTMTGYSAPFDTWASMPQLLDHEQWPDEDRPATVAYFCSVMREEEALGGDDPSTPAAAHRIVGAHVREFVGGRLASLLPGFVDDDGQPQWDLLCGAGDDAGEDRLRSQYWRANVDPSDRYVQSLPGTDHLRLRSDASGFHNMVLAGDWTDNGINAGCIEAAVLSGLKAANALLGRDRKDGVLGIDLDDW